MTDFIPCKYSCVLKRPAERDLESSTYNLRLSEKEMFSFSFQEKRCRKNCHLTGGQRKVLSIA